MCAQKPASMGVHSTLMSRAEQPVILLNVAKYMSRTTFLATEAIGCCGWSSGEAPLAFISCVTVCGIGSSPYQAAASILAGEKQLPTSRVHGRLLQMKF